MTEKEGGGGVTEKSGKEGERGRERKKASGHKPLRIQKQPHEKPKQADHITSAQLQVDKSIGINPTSTTEPISIPTIGSQRRIKIPSGWLRLLIRCIIDNFCLIRNLL